MKEKEKNGCRKTKEKLRLSKDERERKKAVDE